MPLTHRTDTLVAHDGGELTALVVLPEAGTGPGVLVLHEIMGINDYIGTVAARLADLGYVVAVPDLFWRIDPEHPLPSDEEGLAEALRRVGELDVEEAVRDSDAALAHLSNLPEVTGAVAVLGLCLGGTLAFGVAIRSEPDALVSYYGSGVADALDGAGAVDCPALFHFGANDEYIPVAEVEAVQGAFADRDDVRIQVHPQAGHAFDNPSPLFHHAAAAQEAWGRTVDFLRRTIG
jgi:carboxymethylenebutenolidase